MSDRDKSPTHPPNDPATRLNAAWSLIDKPLVAFLRTRLKSRDEAREVAHETYLRMVDSADSEVIRNPVSFAVAVAKNLLAERLRDRLCHQQLDKQFAIKQQLQFGTEEQRSPEKIYAARQAFEQITQEFDALSEDEKEVFVAVRLDGESAQAIAKRLDMKLRTVYRRLKSALVRLGDAIGRPRGERDK